jgi:hypothetical protein
MFSVCAVQRYICCLTPTHSTLIFLSSDSSSHVYATSQSNTYTAHRPTLHFLQKYSMLRVCLCSEHTRHRRCFPLEGQCCECFTSSRLSWDAAGLGLPLVVPLAVTLSSCEWIINSRTRISRKLLCVILQPHDLCIRNAFRMAMCVR